MNNTTKDEAAKTAALSLLSRGLISMAEASRLTGVDRQLIKYWCRDIPVKRNREALVTKLWRSQIKRSR